MSGSGVAPNEKRPKDSRPPSAVLLRRTVSPGRWREGKTRWDGRSFWSAPVFSGAFGAVQIVRANHDQFGAFARCGVTENWVTRYRLGLSSGNNQFCTTLHYFAPHCTDFELPNKFGLFRAGPFCDFPRRMNRIEARFALLKREQQKGFIVYIGAGDPSLEATRQLALAFDQVGVDVLELGVPFSDPLADGLVNQLAAQRGLESGTTPTKVLETVAAIRNESQIPIVLYIYFNLIHRRGVERFIQEAARAGVDGLLVLDLPPEEAGNYETLMRRAGLCNIYLVAPTTPEERIQFIVKRGTGFIYYVSREGVTGMQQKISETISQMTAKIRAHTNLPIAIGFGKNPRPHEFANCGWVRHLQS